MMVLACESVQPLEGKSMKFLFILLLQYQHSRMMDVIRMLLYVVAFIFLFLNLFLILPDYFL